MSRKLRELAERFAAVRAIQEDMLREGYFPEEAKRRRHAQARSTVEGTGPAQTQGLAANSKQNPGEAGEGVS